MTERSRTITWADPIANAQQLARLSGLEALGAIITGAAPAPPIAVLMGFALVEAEEGRAVFESEPGSSTTTRSGSSTAAFAATLLDSAMGCAVQATDKGKLVEVATGKLLAHGTTTCLVVER